MSLNRNTGFSKVNDNNVITDVEKAEGHYLISKKVDDIITTYSTDTASYEQHLGEEWRIFNGTKPIGGKEATVIPSLNTIINKNDIYGVDHVDPNLTTKFGSFLNSISTNRAGGEILDTLNNKATLNEFNTLIRNDIRLSPPSLNVVGTFLVKKEINTKLRYSTGVSDPDPRVASNLFLANNSTRNKRVVLDISRGAKVFVKNPRMNNYLELTANSNNSIIETINDVPQNARRYTIPSGKEYKSVFVIISYNNIMTKSGNEYIVNRGVFLSHPILLNEGMNSWNGIKINKSDRDIQIIDEGYANDIAFDGNITRNGFNAYIRKVVLVR